MTVKELIERLKLVDERYRIFVYNSTEEMIPASRIVETSNITEAFDAFETKPNEVFIKII